MNEKEYYMKTKRMLALLLAALMIVGLFAGCSKDGTKDPGKTDPGNSLIDQTKPSQTTAKYAYKADYLDLTMPDGVQYLNPDILKSSAGLIPGDSIYLPSNFIANAISRLWSQRFFSDVKIGAEIEGDSLDLEVFLKERPRVNNWDFEGISKGKKKDLLEKLKLKRGSELSDYVIDKNQKLIKAYWSEKGFRNTEVSTRITNDTLRPQMVNVTFLIDRKHKVKIGKINFTGNEQFKDKRLRRTFKKTHQKSINFFRGTKLNESDYENDKDLLIDFYNSKGYRNATIVSD